MEELYQKLCQGPGDINEHMPTLAKYASECEHVTEFGVRRGSSTVALLCGLPKNGVLESYDIVETPQVAEIGELNKGRGRGRMFNLKDVIDPTTKIDETDMLFIDTLHNGDQVYQELVLHADKVKKYILFHDTVTFWEKGETKPEGLRYGMEKFLRNHKERKVKEIFTNNNGLTIRTRDGLEN